MAPLSRYVVGLGSNLDDRLALLEAAVLRLAALGAVRARSAVYESAPFGGPAQGLFLNAAVLLEAAHSPTDLLAELLRVEAALGRERRERWGPRTVDLDILWAEGLVVDLPGLQIPHARLTERTFALAPLLDVQPDASPPLGGEPYSAWLARLSEPALRRVWEPVDWAKDLVISRTDPHHALR
jgi:2-amino-4-hydroxy-6-hydroxymethyldihydropteridine diphosphokinase